MKKRVLGYFLVLIAIVGLSILTFSFEEDSELSIGVKRSRKSNVKANVISSQISFLLYDKSNNSFRELKDGSTVNSGDRFMINIKNSAVSYLYILNIDATKTIYNVFPNKSVAKANPLWGNDPLSLPVSSGKESAMYAFDNNAGKEVYYVFVSKTKLESIEKIVNGISEKGLKLKDKSSIMNNLEEIYKSGLKNIQMSPGSSNIVWFKNFYSKKLVFIHK
ncbi:MAG: DUF4384 domain-containing protein [Spirochaetota bacterium]|nr:DUF4384 domain-containing protein [Spirochaetota bacterium]